jgi:murein DD-endopeptidase MepM/ murein hydrolase activator NlpD
MIMKNLLLFVILIFPVSSFASEYRLPFNGTWFVAQAGDAPNVNHHMYVKSQYFGIDFARINDMSIRTLYTGNGQKLKDYYSFAQPVISPVKGVIVKVQDGEIDNPIGTKNKNKPFGNYVVIKASENEYVYLAHLKLNSIAVEAGQKMEQGDRIGLCGNSGNSDFPHIHMHVQNESKPFTGIGKNITFESINLELSGKSFSKVNWPLIRGLFVAQETDG